MVLIAETFSISKSWQTIFYYFEVFSIFIFSLEIIARISTADLLYKNLSPLRARIKYLFSPMSLIDVLSVAYFYIPASLVDLRVLRIFRLLRVFRIFKLGHYIDECRLLIKALKDQTKQLLVSSFFLMLILLVSSILMYEIESQAQPDVFENVFSAFWWAVATLTTIGYGDIYPITALGKMLAGVIALTSIGLIAVPTSTIAASFIKQMGSKETKTLCENCQNKITKDA